MLATTLRSPALTHIAWPRPLVLRLALLLGCTAAVALAAWGGQPQAPLQADAELARLLRGMALIKAGLVLAGVGALAWRFGQPVSSPIAWLYLAGAWLAAGAGMLIWQLSFIPLAAALFHVGMFAFLLAAWRDRGADAMRPRVTRLQ